LKFTKNHAKNFLLCNFCEAPCQKKWPLYL